jgi:O-antigen/teichoic acid export membrane protein
MSLEITEVFERGLFWIRLFMVPACSFIFFYSHEIFFLWLGKAWASSESITQILCLGILFNSANWVNFSFLQSKGKESTTAKIPLVEFVIYIPLFMAGLKYWGLLGVGMAWSFRLILDYVFFSLYSAKYFADLKKALGRSTLILSIISLIFVVTLPLELGLGTRSVVFLGTLVSWLWLEFFLQGAPTILRRLNLRSQLPE